MVQEEKELLLKDLCARLPYELWVDYEGNKYLVIGYAHGMVSLTPSTVSSITGSCSAFTELKPYLRPMSSMTKEEENELRRIRWTTKEGEPRMYEWCDYANAHHLDYRGLIPMGLAIAVTEENNPYKD